MIKITKEVLETLFRSRERLNVFSCIQKFEPESDRAGIAAQALAAILLHANYVCGHPNAINYAGIEAWETCVLLDLKTAKQREDKLFFGPLIQFPRYFLEIEPFVPVSDEGMTQKHEFLLQTGFLILGKNECLGAEVHGPNGREFTGAFENNDTGHCRVLPHITKHNFKQWGSPRKIVDLNVRQTEIEIELAIIDMAIGQDRPDVSDLQISKLIDTFQQLTKHKAIAPPETLTSGASIKRWFIEGGDIDSVMHIRNETPLWKRYPTSQDAWYFGVWINTKNRQILSYVEGDASHVTCDTQQQFTTELLQMAKHYGKSRSPDGYGYGKDTQMTKYFTGLYLIEGKIMESVLSEGESKFDPTFNGGAPLLAAIKIDHPDLMTLWPGEKIKATPEHFSLDVCSILAFEPCEAEIVKTLFGFQLEVTRGVKTHIGLYEVPEMVVQS